MNARTMQSRRAGFSLLEVSISSSLLAVAVLTALSISQAATRASTRAVVSSTREAAISRRLESVRRVVTRIAASTLRAVPSSSSDGSINPVAEPMLDGIVYDNLSYREPVGFLAGETTYLPPVDQDPRSIGLVHDESSGLATLVLVDGDNSFELVDDLSDVAFTRVGDELTIVLTTAAGPAGQNETVSHEIHVALHAR